MFSKRHYKAIAGPLSEVKDVQVHRWLVKEYAEMFRADNPRFDAGKFARACRRQGECKEDAA